MDEKELNMDERITISVLKDEHIEKLAQIIKRELIKTRETVPNAEKIIIEIDFYYKYGRPMVDLNISAYTSVSRLLQNEKQEDE
jgi:hypothetical protein